MSYTQATATATHQHTPQRHTPRQHARQVVELRRASCHVDQRLVHVAALHDAVAAVVLGVCLLHQHHPQLPRVVVVGECWQGVLLRTQRTRVVGTAAVTPALVGVHVGLDGEPVVHDDVLPRTVFPEPHGVHAVFARLLRHQDAVQEVLSRRQHRQRGKQVAVTEGALLDVVEVVAVRRNGWGLL